MADMYTGFRPWEMIQGGFSNLSQTGERAYAQHLALKQRQQALDQANAPINPALAEYYRKVLGGLDGQPQAPELSMPQLQAAPIPQIRGLAATAPQAMPITSPLPTGPADGSAPPVSQASEALGAKPQRVSIVDQLTADDTPPIAAPTSVLTSPDRGQPPPAQAAQAAPPQVAQPAQKAPPQAATASDPDAPIALQSPVPGKAPWMIRNRDLPALQALLPIAQEHLRQAGQNQRIGITQGTRAAIAQLRASTGNEQLAAKLEADLAKNDAKLTNEQQIAVIKQVAELDRSMKQFQAKMHQANKALEAAKVAADARVSDSMNKSDATIQAAKMAADARVSDSMNKSDATVQAAKVAADARKYAARAGIASATESARIAGTAKLGAADLARQGKEYAADKAAETAKLKIEVAKLKIETATKARKDLKLEYTKQLMRMASNEMLLATPSGRDAFRNAVNHVNSVLEDEGEQPFNWELTTPEE